MNNTTKILMGGLIVVNLALVGLLLFRDHSMARVQAQAGTAAATAESAAPAAESVTATAPQPALETVAAPTEEADPAEMEAEEIEIEPEPAPAPRAAKKTAEPAKRPAAARPESPRRVAAHPVPALPEPVPTLESESTEDPWRAREAERANGPDTAPVPAERETAPPKPVTVTVPAGTRLGVRLEVALNSRDVKNGDRFEGSLAQDLLIDGHRVARAGAPVTGRVLEVIEAGRVQGKESMKVTLDEVTLAAKTFRVDTSNLTFTAQDTKEKDAAVIGGAAAVGAIIGAIAKGGKGAATGAATGAAAGTGVVLATKGKPVELASGTQLDFTLEETLRVTLPRGETERDQPEPRPREDSGNISRR